VPLTRQVLKETIKDATKVSLIENMAKISVVGVGMRNHPGVAARFFKILSANDIPIHLVTTSEIKISAVIDHTHLQQAAKTLHAEFDLDRVD
jgi:aspartate kinase